MNPSERRVPDDPTVLSQILSGPEGEFTFRQLAEAIPQLVWTTRPDGYHDYFNQRWYDYTGMLPGSTVGEGWCLPFHPEDVPEAARRWRHSLLTGELYEVEYRCRRHDGVYRWFLGRAQPVRDASGRIVRVVSSKGYFRDVNIGTHLDPQVSKVFIPQQTVTCEL